jgi:general secretion pathway protein G
MSRKAWWTSGAIAAVVVIASVVAWAPLCACSKSRADRAVFMVVTTALEIYKLEHSRYPTSGEGLVALTAAPPHLATVPVDSWGHDYVYVSPGVHNPSAFDLSSNGADGQPGGGDDITNWEHR